MRRGHTTYLANGYGGISKVKELVHAWENHGPEYAEDPRAEGGDGHVWVVVVGDGGAHFGVGRVVLCGSASKGTISARRVSSEAARHQGVGLGRRGKEDVVALTEPGRFDIEIGVKVVGDGGCGGVEGVGGGRVGLFVDAWGRRALSGAFGRGGGDWVKGRGGGGGRTDGVGLFVGEELEVDVVEDLVFCEAGGVDVCEGTGGVLACI